MGNSELRGCDVQMKEDGKQLCNILFADGIAKLFYCSILVIFVIYNRAYIVS